MENTTQLKNSVQSLAPFAISNRKINKLNEKDDIKFVRKLFIPSALVFFFGILFPLIIGIFISFTNSSGQNYFGTKITLINYWNLIFKGDTFSKQFWQYSYQTIFFAIAAVSLEFVLGLIFALLLNKEFKGRGLARATLLIPWALPTVASATLFRVEFLAPASDYGLFNSLLLLIGSRPISFFGADAATLFTLPCFVPFIPLGSSTPFLPVEITWTMLSSILVDVWKTTPYFSLLIIAALQIVPDDLSKAADIAGANGWQKFWKITWPMIKPGVATALIFRIMDAVRVYDAVVVFRDDSVYSMTMQSVSFWRNTNFGYASTIAMIEFIIILLFAGIVLKLLSKKSKKQKELEQLAEPKSNLQEESPEDEELQILETDEIVPPKPEMEKEMFTIRDRSIILAEEKQLRLNPISDNKIAWYVRKRKIKKVIFVILILGMISFCAAPFLWILLRSFRDPFHANAQTSFELFPKIFDFKSFSIVLSSTNAGINFGRSLLNSFILASLTALIVVAIGSFTGYALAKFKFKQKALVTLIIFSMTSLPPLIIIIPYYLQMKAITSVFPFFKINDNLLGLLLPYSAFNLPLATFVLRSFFQEVPEDLWNAAKVDGATNMQIFRKVIMPLTVPGVFTCIILVFIAAWNELLFAQIWLTSSNHYTIPQAILSFGTNMGTLTKPWVPNLVLMAATSIATVPLVILVLVFQKQIIKGITSGAVKG
ncbi:MAG: ABC transporter permease [Promethearchaeota archaeon]